MRAGIRRSGITHGDLIPGGDEVVCLCVKGRERQTPDSRAISDCGGRLGPCESGGIRRAGRSSRRRGGCEATPAGLTVRAVEPCVANGRDSRGQGDVSTCGTAGSYGRKREGKGAPYLLDLLVRPDGGGHPQSLKRRRGMDHRVQRCWAARTASSRMVRA